MTQPAPRFIRQPEQTQTDFARRRASIMTMLRSWGAILSLLMLAACASLPPQADRAPTHAFTDTDDTQEEFTKQYPFGYILEKLAFYQFEKIVSKNIASLAHSLKIIFNDEDTQKEIDHKTIDEFDIALLTKNGKFIIFECKSGGMGGDVAKSTKYSTYAVSGVYGLPILIAPLLESEIENLKKLGDEYDAIKSAVKSAKRANLEVWGIDKIKEKLTTYISNP